MTFQQVGIILLLILVVLFSPALLLLARRALPFVRAFMAGDVIRLSVWPGSEGDRDGADTGATLAVPQPQHQAKPELVPDLTAIKTYLKQHNVSDQDAIDILALLRRPTGDNLISANKIRDIVGGNEAAVKAQVAALRPKPPAPRTQGHADRPANGW
jgi:hypothetical protein